MDSYTLYMAMGPREWLEELVGEDWEEAPETHQIKYWFQKCNSVIWGILMEETYYTAEELLCITKELAGKFASPSPDITTDQWDIMEALQIFLQCYSLAAGEKEWIRFRLRKN